MSVTAVRTTAACAVEPLANQATATVSCRGGDASTGPAGQAAVPEMIYNMPLAGVRDLTLSDFPGHPATILFFRGCNMACAYCHNHAVRCAGPRLAMQPVLERLLARRQRVHGVVLSGGEPTIHAGPPVLARFLQDQGLAVKVDTNGARPQMVRTLVQQGLVNYMALDIKASLFNKHYHDEVVGRNVFAPLVRASLHVLRHHLPKTAWEARTTICGRQHTEAQLLEIAAELRPGERWALQAVRPPAGSERRRRRRSCYRSLRSRLDELALR
jgi:pyruvate formate lyase activating enzyme